MVLCIIGEEILLTLVVSLEFEIEAENVVIKIFVNLDV